MSFLLDWLRKFLEVLSTFFSVSVCLKIEKKVNCVNSQGVTLVWDSLFLTFFSVKINIELNKTSPIRCINDRFNESPQPTLQIIICFPAPPSDRA